MQVIEARNVNDAFVKGVKLLWEDGVLEGTRAGRVLVYPSPVTTVYNEPTERVLFNAQRDANPFFHLMEALWMLAGRKDATWLDRFVSDFSKRFAEDDGLQHGAYGYRWRNHFDIDWEGSPYLPDQLSTAIALLKRDPTNRRAVITMWDPVADLGITKRDLPCNTHIYLRVRGGELDMTVCCRSNDIIWGAYGANAVHFSVLQEYLAAKIGILVGKYYQVSNNFHAYTDVMNRVGVDEQPDPYAKGDVLVLPLVNDPKAFDDDLQWFFQYTTVTPGKPTYEPRNKFLSDVAVPMFLAYKEWRDKRELKALEIINFMPHCDWWVAAEQFFQRRIDRREKEKGYA